MTTYLQQVENNYSILMLKIDYENKALTLFKGRQTPLEKALKTTKTRIYETINILKTMGFYEIKSNY